ncbi:uncharacterized protein [Diadema antillarum]|uniref:uncharacterized protein n=1 Tax=Diadema antillarum TaxID=105358 RepID=UPI003A83D45E
MDPDKPRLVDLARQFLASDTSYEDSEMSSTEEDTSESKKGPLPASTGYPYPEEQYPGQNPRAEPSAPLRHEDGTPVSSARGGDAAAANAPPGAYHQTREGPQHLPDQTLPGPDGAGNSVARTRPDNQLQRVIKVEDKSLCEAYILCIPLGFLGLHHFYLGRIGIGFLYFFTLGVFGIGWIIDWFRLPWLVKSTNRKRREKAERGYILYGGPFNELEDRQVSMAYLYWLPPVGLLGGHHYYLGRIWFGALYTLTLGLFGVGWLVDVFRIYILTKRANEDIRTLRSGRPIPTNDPDRMHLDDAYVLAFPLGFLGLHHFYMRRWMVGVVYFLTFGCMGIGFLIDLFRLPYLLRRRKRELAAGEIKYHLDDAYLMWFPLGPLGLHHMYLGRWVWGIAYFFTLGLVGIGWLIDFCRLPVLVRRANEKLERQPLISNASPPAARDMVAGTHPSAGTGSVNTFQNSTGGYPAPHQGQVPSGNMAVYAFPLDAHGHPIWTQGVSWAEEHRRDPSTMPPWLPPATGPSVALPPTEPPPPYSPTDGHTQPSAPLPEDAAPARLGNKDFV